MIRTGLGIDAHALEAGRPLVLGGVTVDHPAGLAGHSDGDVVCHAIADALLSAARLGDLGEHFPNDERWRDARSTDLLTSVAAMMRAAGWSIVNVDATIVAEAPRLSPLRDEMIARVAESLAVDPSRVWMKATTGDGLGFIGRGEGMAAVAVALIEREDASPS